MPTKILIVDDEPTNSEVMERICKKAGWHVDKASSGGDAYQHIVKDTPDLLLLDIMLPDILGTDLCLKIRKERRFDNIKIMLITGKKIEFIDQRIGHSLGADAYIARPSDPNDLLNSIQNVLEQDSEKVRNSIDSGIDDFEHRNTSFTASSFQQVSIKDAYPEEFAALSAKFSALVGQAMEERIYKSDQLSSVRAKELSRELGFLKANALDVIHLYNDYLKQSAAEESAEKYFYLREESRIILLELMGYLLNYYRNLSTL